MSEAAVAELAAVGRRSNQVAVWVLIVLATLVMVLSTLNTWLERQLLDTDSWVDTSVALVEDDEVREELSVRLVNALYENVDVGAAIDERLPEQLKGLGVPAAGLLRDPLIGTANRILQTRTVLALWSEANRVAHAAVVAVFEDDVGDNLSTSGGVVVIDLGGVVRQLGEQIGLPQGVLDAIPDDAGVFEVVDSDRLAQAQNSVRIVKILSVVFFLLVVLGYIGAIYLAGNWRREAVRNVGVATALGGFVVLVALRIAITIIGRAPDTEGARAVADSVLVIGTTVLRQMAWSEILIGLLIALGASLIGPARYAQWVRSHAAVAFKRAPVATWILVAVAVLAVLVWSPFTASGNWLTVLIVLGLVPVGVEALRRTSLTERGTAGR